MCANNVIKNSPKKEEETGDRSAFMLFIRKSTDRTFEQSQSKVQAATDVPHLIFIIPAG